MQRLLMLSVSAVVTIYSPNAIADSSYLKRTYGFTGSDACLYASGGFNDRLQAPGTTFSSAMADEGVETFNGNGTGAGAFIISTTSITPPPTVGFLPAASSSQSGASITDNVADDTFTIQTVPGTDIAKVLTGPRAEQTFKLEGVPTRTGLISAEGRTLITSDGDVEHRICWRSRVLIKVDAD